MGWNPLKDIKNGLKKLEDHARQEIRNVNHQFYDDILGIEKGNVSDFAKGGIVGANRARIDDKTARAQVAADKAVADAQLARDMPTIIANQARAARRKRMREQSLMAGGATAGGSGGAALSSVMAMGKQSLGA